MRLEAEPDNEEQQETTIHYGVGLGAFVKFFFR